ncbi:MAG: tyrosine-type recombinase/integrase [Acidimicrobiales bacterium]
MDVARLVRTAEERDPDLGCFLRLSATTGARRGELCGLRWCDVDLRQCAITISRAVVEDSRGVAIEKDTKTHAARRIALVHHRGSYTRVVGSHVGGTGHRSDR